MGDLVIPQDLKGRYETLLTYVPMDLVVTDIRAIEWLKLIERIAELERQLTDEALAFNHANETVAKLEAQLASSIGR